MDAGSTLTSPQPPAEMTGRKPRSCQQLDHPSPRAAGFFNLVASPSALPWPSFWPGKRLGHASGLPRVSPLVGDPPGPTRGFAVDATPTQHGPHDPCRLVRHRRPFHPRRASTPRIHWLRLPALSSTQRRVARAPWINRRPDRPRSGVVRPVPDRRGQPVDDRPRSASGAG
jgi:hypothetical protein